MSINKKAVGQRIKLIRQSKGMTLEEFGKLLEASKGNVSTWEKGVSLPSNKRIKKLASIGNMTVEELLYGNPIVKTSVDKEQYEKGMNFVDSKREIVLQELKLLAPGAISGLFTAGIGFKKWQEKALKNHEIHRERIKSLESFVQEYIDRNYDNYTYEKYLKDFPNSDPQGFEEYKEKEWKIFKALLEEFWTISDDTAKYYSLINSGFTDQIFDELESVDIKAIKEKKRDYYVDEVIQPFLDQAAKDFKEYIKEYIDTED